jgi:hypothetical protein
VCAACRIERVDEVDEMVKVKLPRKCLKCPA